MLNGIIRFSLRQPLLILALAVIVLVLGTRNASQLPIDVFPDLDRPRVVVITEAPGMAPEDVEQLINVPLESVLSGAPGVIAVRTSAAVGISVTYVEFDYGTDIYTDRQIVNERLAIVADKMDRLGAKPTPAPISSIMGQVMLVGMYVDRSDESARHTSMLGLRQDADWLVRRRLMNVQGVAQVFVMGGENGGGRQVQVLVNPDQMRRLDVTLHQVEQALAQSNENATGGYIQVGANELLVRSLGRIETLDDLKSLVIDGSQKPPIVLEQVATIQDGPAISRGTASVNGHPAVMLMIVKQPGADTRKLTQAVVEELQSIKPSLPDDVQINSSVYRMDSFIDRAINNVVEALRDGAILVVIILFIFLLNFRTTFITLTAIPLSILITALVFRLSGLSINTMTLGGLAVAIGELVDDAIVDVENIFRRLRENRKRDQPQPTLKVVFQASAEIRNSIFFGSLIVVLVFLPLFALHGMEGRLFRPLAVAYIVSILSSLVVSLTVTPVLSYLLLGRRWIWSVVAAGICVGMSAAAIVFLPLELTWWLRAVLVVVIAAGGWLVMMVTDRFSQRERQGPVLLALQWLAAGAIRFGLTFRWPVLVCTSLLALIAGAIALNMGRNFLPPFNEGSVQVTLALPPGTSLKESNHIARQVEMALLELDDVVEVGRRTGRAEEDEHAVGVNLSELILSLDEDSPRTRNEQLELIRETLDGVPGAESKYGVSTTEQPISHLMSHMMSGVKAQIAIKIYGSDLDVLRNAAEEVRAAIDGTEGVKDLFVEQQVLVPQLQIRLRRDKLELRGLKPEEVNHMIETAMRGRIVSQVLEGDATFDLIIRLDDPFRESVDALRNLSLELPAGGTIPLADIAELQPDRAGPNTINRENNQRRIVVQCNTSGRAVSEVRDEIQQRLAGVESRLSSTGAEYHIKYGGQFESEQAATRQLALWSAISVLGVFLVLYTLFRSVNLSLQVMAALPMAVIGAVAAMIVTRQSLSVPSMVGFISLAGIASRNGILLITHYLHLVRFEGEQLTRQMIVRAGRERVAPVLMTALTSGIGLIPLAIAADQPGKEILYPVATVIIGGLISSTLLDFFVRPALFWTFGRGVAKRLLIAREQELPAEEVGGAS